MNTFPPLWWFLFGLSIGITLSSLIIRSLS